MNEQRIRERVKRAQSIAAENHTPGGRDYEHEVYVKFAEFIVERIIDTVECHASLFNTKEARQVCSWIIKSIKYDYGIDE